MDFLENFGEHMLERKAEQIPEKLVNAAKKQYKDATNTENQTEEASKFPSTEKDEEVARLRKQLALTRSDKEKATAEAKQRRFASLDTSNADTETKALEALGEKSLSKGTSKATKEKQKLETTSGKRSSMSKPTKETQGLVAVDRRHSSGNTAKKVQVTQGLRAADDTRVYSSKVAKTENGVQVLEANSGPRRSIGQKQVKFSEPIGEPQHLEARLAQRQSMQHRKELSRNLRPRTPLMAHQSRPPNSPAYTKAASLSSRDRRHSESRRGARDDGSAAEVTDEALGKRRGPQSTRKTQDKVRGREFKRNSSRRTSFDKRGEGPGVVEVENNGRRTLYMVR
ncbi:hypothetical protein MMC28_007295 [Mycoblastus sanguinarius]|nr:hypothetical protein [Mycoblastus sanguinarius]